MYGNKDWWHNYQIYRNTDKIFDNTPNKSRTPCFAYLPWDTLKKGDKLVLEVWSPDNHSKYINKEQTITYLKGLEKLRGLHFKVVEKDETIYTWHWYFTKLQMFSALTAVRYVCEDNWNTHYPIVQYTLENFKTMKFIEALKKAHFDFYNDKKGISGNSGHALTYIAQRPNNFPVSLSKLRQLKEKQKSINDFWT